MKRYNSFGEYFRKKYGVRMQKLVIDAGFTCPNRDGTLGTGGCSFCDNAAFHPAYGSPSKSVTEQIEDGISFHRSRGRDVSHCLAYFQSFSNTYAPLPRLRALYGEALSHPAVCGIVVGTRPDCVDEEKLDFIASLGEDGKAVMIEYGIESCRDETLGRVGRGHDFACAARAVRMTADRGIATGAHFILGLPGESRDMLVESCAAINSLSLTSVKFHQLQLLRGTAIAAEYAAHPEDFYAPGLDEYVDLLADMLERLRPDLYIDRIAASVPPRFVEVRRWGLVDTSRIAMLLDRRLEARNTFQGAKFY